MFEILLWVSRDKLCRLDILYDDQIKDNEPRTLVT